MAKKAPVPLNEIAASLEKATISAEEITAYRERLGASVEEFAAAAGLQPSLLARLESGYPIRPVHIIALERLSLSVAAFAGPTFALGNVLDEAKELAAKADDVEAWMKAQEKKPKKAKDPS